MMRKPQKGFTLLEIAIVLFILSIILVMGLKGIRAQMTNAAYTVTKGHLQIIEDSLINFLLINRRLPCPDTNATPNGNANTNTPCSNFGVLPWNDLGLTQDIVLDGWDNYISYRVSNSPAPLAEWTIAKIPNSFFDETVNNQGSIQVNDASGAQIGGLDAAVLVSHGRNGEGARTIKGKLNFPPSGANELLNTNGTNNFVDQAYTDDPASPGGSYDDVVVRLSPFDLITVLVKSSVLKPQTGQDNDAIDQVRRDIDEITSRVINLAITACQAQSVSDVGSLPNDPWGAALVYSSTSTNTLTATGTNNGDFTVTSNGSATVPVIFRQTSWSSVAGKLAAYGVCP